MQNGILKTTLGELLATLAAFLVTFWVFLPLPASFLFVVFVFLRRFVLLWNALDTIYKDLGNL